MKSKKRVLVIALAFVLMSICAAALCYTPQSYKDYVHTDDIVTTIDGQDIVDSNAKESAVLAVDLTSVEGVTPYLVIKFKTPAYGTYYDIYTYASNDYSKISGVTGAPTYSASGYAVIELDSLDGVAAIGIPYRIDDSLDCIEVHENAPTFEYKPGTLRIKRFLVCELMVILIALGLYWLDTKVSCVESMICYLKNNFKRRDVLIGFVVFIALAFVAFAIEMIIKTVILANGGATAFRITRFFFVYGALCSVAWLVHMRNQFEEHTAKVFLGLIWTVGVTVILTCPFGHAGWDIDSHYSLALTASNLGIKNQTETDLLITNARGASLIKNTYDDNIGTIGYLNYMYGDVVDCSLDSISIAHLPAGIGIAVGRMFHLPFYFIFIMGEFMNLMVYSILCAIAINKLKSGKFILLSIALFPTNVFMACCYNYDYWLLGFSFVGMSYFISALQTMDEKISFKDELIMCFAIMIACIPKQIYLPMLLFPVLMPWKKMRSRVRYYLTAALPFLALAVLLMIRTFSEVNTTGDIRGGTGINPVEQLHFILGNIPTYIGILIRFMVKIFSFDYLKQAVTNYGNLGYYPMGAAIILLLVVVVAFLDKKECDIPVGNWKTRTYAALFMIGEAALISTAFYMAFSAVGANDINGVQARYLTPMMYPLAAVVGVGKWNIKFNRNYLGWAVFGIETVVLFMGMEQAMLLRMV